MQHADWLICSAWNQDHNKTKLCCSKLTLALLSATTFFNPQQMFLLRDKLITQREKRETSTKNLKRNNAARQVCIPYFAALKCFHQHLSKPRTLISFLLLFHEENRRKNETIFHYASHVFVSNSPTHHFAWRWRF